MQPSGVNNNWYIKRELLQSDRYHLPVVFFTFFNYNYNN